MFVSVQQRECKRTDYDSRSTWDGFLDAGSIPARSTETLLHRLESNAAFIRDGNIAQLGERSPD